MLTAWRWRPDRPGLPQIEMQDALRMVFGPSFAVLCRELIGAVPFAATDSFVYESGSCRLACHHASRIEHMAPMQEAPLGYAEPGRQIPGGMARPNGGT